MLTVSNFRELYYKGRPHNKMVNLKVKNGGRTITQGHDEQLRTTAYHPSLQSWLHHKTVGTLQRYHPLHLDFVVRLSDRANEMCEQASKKTISAEHLEAALIVSMTLFRTLDWTSIQRSWRSWGATSRKWTSWSERPVNVWRRAFRRSYARRGSGVCRSNRKGRRWFWGRSLGTYRLST